MTPNSHVFVTGGTGFVGSYMLRQLLSKGYNKITAIRRKESRTTMIADIKNRITWVEADLFDFQIIQQTLVDVDVIIHSAAMISFGTSERRLMHKVNVEGTELLLNAALTAGVDRFLFISSVAALGRTKELPLINESSQFQNTNLDTEYGRTKHMAEMQVWRAESEGLHVAIINPAMIMGAGYWDTGTARLVDTIAKRLNYYPLGTSGFVDVRDVARMSIQILEEEKDHFQVICCAQSMKIQDMMNLICGSLGKNRPKIALTSWLRELAWRAESIRSLLTGQFPLVTKETVRSSAQAFTFDNSRSIQDLSFAYTPLEKTIEETSSLYQESRQNRASFGLLSSLE